MQSEDPQPEEHPDLHFSFQSQRILLLSIPIAFALGALTKLTTVFDMLSWMLFSIPMHEMGHAVMAWFTGRFAIPIGAIIPMAAFTTFSQSRSTAVFIALSAVLLYVAFRAYRSHRNFPLVTALSFFVISAYLNFKITDEQSLMLAVYAGNAGEFVLSAFLVIAFYYPGLPGFRWDFFRFPIMLYGSIAFVRAYWTWHLISQGLQQMPIGSFLDGSESRHGDIQRLIHDYGWSAESITRSYLKLGNICLLLIGIHYLYFLLTQPRRPRI